MRGWGGVDVSGDRVQQLGFVPDDELARAVPRRALRRVPLGLRGVRAAVVEAMACGAPVVAANAGSAPEVTGGAAVLVDPSDPDAIAAGLAEAIDRREELRALGLERAQAFSWDAGRPRHRRRLPRGRGVTPPLVVIDADVLGRRRTGDETYVAGLLRGLLRARTRTACGWPPSRGGRTWSRPGSSRSSSRRGARSCGWRSASPGSCGGLRPAVAHFLHALPRGYSRPVGRDDPGPLVRADATVMGVRDRLIFASGSRAPRRRARRILTLSELTKRDLVELYGVPEEKIVVTPPGVDPVFRPDGPEPDGEPYALFVSALQAAQGPVAAIEAVALLGDDAPRLVLVGPDKGGRADAERAVERAGPARPRQFRGHVSLEELAGLYRGAACLVFPSRYEGFGLPVLEAMASGTPVVTTTAGALPEAAGDAAILVGRSETPSSSPAGSSGRSPTGRDSSAAGLERARAVHLGRDRPPDPRRLPGARRDASPRS